MPSRRAFLAAGLGLATAGCTGTDDPGATPTPTDPPTDTGTDRVMDGEFHVGLETVTDAPSAPLAYQTTPAGVAYVADRPGIVYRIADGGVETALDLTDTVVTGGERGLLGMALHPDFGAEGRLYLRYSAPSGPGTPEGYSHTFVLAEFTAAADGTIDPASERTVLEIPQPQANHNSGPIAFGPEGYLYVGVGDGGAGGDQGEGHVTDWYDVTQGGNGQDVTANLLGSLLRIDVDDRSGDRAYGIPPENPLVGEDGLDEHYAWGLRNPWGISFDDTDLYVADVGQNRFEEVNLIERGGNYGWNVREGTHCFGAEDCPDTTPEGAPLRDPVVEYGHDEAPVSGAAIVGGHVYRGDAIPALGGTYVFGDLSAAGRLFVARPTADGRWPTATLPVASATSDQLGQLLAIARDGDEELYALTPAGVHRIVRAT